MKRGIPLYKNPVTDERLQGRVSKIPDASVTVTFRLEDVKKLKNWCGEISALKNNRARMPSKRSLGVGIHFASA